MGCEVWFMKHKTKIMIVVVAALCSACDFSVEALFQPIPFAENSGPLTSAEIQYFTSNMKESVSPEQIACISKEAAVRAAKLGDPETLDPTQVELLPVDGWSLLDKPGKRLLLTQVVINQTLPLCSHSPSSPFAANSGPLTNDEIQHFASKMKESTGDEVAACLSKEAAARASKLGDPEMLDPTTVDISADHWIAIDKYSKRFLLAYEVVMEAIPICTMGKGK